MKYPKDDYRSNKPGTVAAVGPREILISGTSRIDPKYRAAPGPNRKTRRAIKAIQRRLSK